MAAYRRAMSISRRQFMQGTGALGLGLLVGGCGVPFSQPSSAPRSYRIGWLGSSRPLPSGPEPGTSYVYDAFLDGLRELGYEEGRTHHLIWRTADGDAARLREMAAELVQLPVDVIVVTAGVGPLAKEATATIPIVLAGGPDPVAWGLVASYARPGGNITGVPAGPAGPFFGKLLEFLQAAVPALSRVGVLFDASLPQTPLAPNGVLLATAQTLGLDIHPMSLQSMADLGGVWDAAVQARVDGVVVVQSALLGRNLVDIAGLALRHRIPSVGIFRDYAEAGGLMAHGPSLRVIMRRAAAYVDKILKGASPATLPIEQPREFDLVVNARTVQALDLRLSPTVMLQATEIIQ